MILGLACAVLACDEDAFCCTSGKMYRNQVCGFCFLTAELQLLKSIFQGIMSILNDSAPQSQCSAPILEVVCPLCGDYEGVKDQAFDNVD